MTTHDHPWTPKVKQGNWGLLSFDRKDFQRYEEAHDAMYKALARLVGEPEEVESSWSNAVHECSYCAAGEVPLDEPLPHTEDCPIVEARAARAQAKDGAR